MVELWFAIVALSFTAYVVLDGFDLGAGAVYPFVARSDQERRQVLAAIGPFWHGNEVWLLAAGGALFAAFPRVLASGLSGFYFAFFLVLWVLILRGVSIKFRGEVNHPLWRTAWDVMFAGANLLLPVLFGAAFGNLVRGLPLDAEGWFSLPLFTDFTAKPPVGILDWYTVLAGLFALIAVAGHGATFLLWKSDGPVHARSRRAAQALYGAVVVLWPLLTVITWLVDAPMLAALPGRPLAWLSLLLAVAGLVGVHRSLRAEPAARGIPGILRLPDRDAGGNGGLRLPRDATRDRRWRRIPHRAQRERAGIEPRDRARLVGRRGASRRPVLRPDLPPAPREAGRRARARGILSGGRGRGRRSASNLAGADRRRFGWDSTSTSPR